MKLNAKTKIDDLLKQFPFLEDFLITLSPKFKGLKNPIMRKTMGKVASLEMAASVSGLSVDKLISSLTEEIEKQSGQYATSGESAPASQSEPLTDPKERQTALKGIIKDLHDGEDMEVLKQRFKDLIQDVDAPEIAKIEQELMNEGLPAEEIKRLCHVHVEIFKEALEEQDRPDPPAGHPIHTYMKENRASEKIMSDMSILLGLLGQPPTAGAFEEHGQALGELIEQLSEINTHYTRKENQLFPMLEAHHFTGPSQVMWSIHDDIRAHMKQTREAYARKDPVQTMTSLKEAIQAVRDMIYKEEHILFPTCLDMLTDNEWVKVKEGEADIDFAWVVPDTGWPDEILKETGAPAAEPEEVLKDVAGALGLDTGSLNLEQINL
ncbi:MAG: DUF438 domain-containing protein, partial [Deltaproteobacteria bacterium]|nr:DUF438 domain-containing protein [Deltaproteobacteria bacterium]